MKRLTVLVAVSLFTLCASVAFAQDEGAAEGGAEAQAPPGPPGHAALDSWVGDWTFTGTMFGSDASGSVNWQWMLGGWYLRGSETVTVAMGDQAVEISAEMTFIPAADGTVMGYYMNSMGEHHPMTFAEADGSYVMTWDDMHGSHRYTITSADGAWNAVMETQGEDGEYAPSGGVTYTRAQ